MGKDKFEDSSNKWEDMDDNILMNIFAFLSVMDVVMNATRVCRSWLTAAKDHLQILKTLDLTNVRRKPVVVTELSAWPEAEIAKFVRIIPNPAVNISCGNLNAMVFGLSSFAKDAHLLYAAQRCPNLKLLVLPSLPEIVEEKLAAAFKLWPKLESLAISFSTDVPSPIVLESISQNCKVLKSLRFRSKHFLKETALIITRCLPNLRILSFWSARIQHQAVLIVLENLKNLEEMYIAHKSIQNMERYGMGGAITFCFLILLQNEEIVREARRLQKFHVCLAARCGECPNQLDEVVVVQRF